MCTMCIDNLYAWAHTKHTYTHIHSHARACTETGNGINHLLQPINRTFRYPEVMRRDAFPPISSKSHLIRATCACRAVRDCADRKLHRGVPRVRSRRKGCGSESYPHELFPPILISSNRHFRTRHRCLVLTCEPLSHILDGTRQIFATTHELDSPLFSVETHRIQPSTWILFVTICHVFPFSRVISG